MTRPVSIVIPTLADHELLERSLPPLLAEVQARAIGDEVVLVDDSGNDVLAAWTQERSPEIQVVARRENGGFGAAVLDGVRRAEHPLVFVMNPDVVVRPGFLAPLVDALASEDVLAASPRVLLDGDESKVESRGELDVEDGRLIVREPTGVPLDATDEPRPISFAVGGAMLVRREEFLDAQNGSPGFDPLFAPFYWEDVDFCLAAWRRGRRVVEVPTSVVEHHHRGTIGAHVPDDLVRAAIERNRLLVHWKHLSDRRAAHDHLAALWRDALDAGMAGRREELLWMALALEELESVNASRATLSGASMSLEDALVRMHSA